MRNPGIGGQGDAGGPLRAGGAQRSAGRAPLDGASLRAPFSSLLPETREAPDEGGRARRLLEARLKLEGTLASLLGGDEPEGHPSREDSFTAENLDALRRLRWTLAARREEVPEDRPRPLDRRDEDRRSDRLRRDERLDRREDRPGLLERRDERPGLLDRRDGLPGLPDRRDERPGLLDRRDGLPGLLDLREERLDRREDRPGLPDRRDDRPGPPDRREGRGPAERREEGPAVPRRREDPRDDRGPLDQRGGPSERREDRGPPDRREGGPGPPGADGRPGPRPDLDRRGVERLPVRTSPEPRSAPPAGEPVSDDPPVLEPPARTQPRAPRPGPPTTDLEAPPAPLEEGPEPEGPGRLLEIRVRVALARLAAAPGDRLARTILGRALSLLETGPRLPERARGPSGFQEEPRPAGTSGPEERASPRRPRSGGEPLERRLRGWARRQARELRSDRVEEIDPWPAERERGSARKARRRPRRRGSSQRNLLRLLRQARHGYAHFVVEASGGEGVPHLDDVEFSDDWLDRRFHGFLDSLRDEESERWRRAGRSGGPA